MAKVSLSQNTFESLVKHLVEIEEKKKSLLEEFFPENPAERSEMELYIHNYIQQIDQLIKNTNKLQTTDNMIPFVTIGSEVELQDLSTQEVFKYHIVYPFSDNIKEEDVSFLSPVGKSLLLKKAGDIVEVTAPGGVFQYEIKSILLHINELQINAPI